MNGTFVQCHTSQRCYPDKSRLTLQQGNSKGHDEEEVPYWARPLVTWLTNRTSRGSDPDSWDGTPQSEVSAMCIPCLWLLPPAFAPIWRVSMVLSYWDCCLVLTTHPVALEPHGHVWRLCPLTGSNFLSSWVFYWGCEACHYHGWQPWSSASIFFFVPR